MGQGLGGFNGGRCFYLCVQGFDRVHAFDLAAFGPTRFLGFRGISLLRVLRLRFASLHLRSVFGCAKRSLRSHARINPTTQPSDVARGSRSRAGELTLGLSSGEEHSVVGFGFVVDLPLTPALSRGRGGRFMCFSKSEFSVVSHVGVPLPNTSVSPLSLWERVRVRGF